MKSLFDYPFIVNELFYKGWHLFEYMEKHKLTELDKEAIKATIMDALVYKELINPEEEFLNLESLSITNNPNDYHYTKTPNVSCIPQHIKDILRRKCVKQSASVPIMLFIAKPPSKWSRYCVYDPNYAVSSVFPEASFYECIYDSPTRPGIRLEKTRPFVEVSINGELYLVDTITNRIFRSSWFKETYNMEIKDTVRTTKLTKKQQKIYKEMCEERCILAEMIPIYKLNMELPIPDFAETNYEVEQTKKIFPEEWERAERIEEEMKNSGTGSFFEVPIKK